jgi:hypothetical protein
MFSVTIRRRILDHKRKIPIFLWSVDRLDLSYQLSIKVFKSFGVFVSKKVNRLTQKTQIWNLWAATTGRQDIFSRFCKRNFLREIGKSWRKSKTATFFSSCHITFTYCKKNSRFACRTLKNFKFQISEYVVLLLDPKNTDQKCRLFCSKLNFHFTFLSRNLYERCP